MEIMTEKINTAENIAEEINSKQKELFIRYGSAASEAMFDFPCNYFQIPDGTGFIAYRIEFNCAIIFGDPICPSEEQTKLTQEFHKFCTASALSVIYITVSEGFKDWLHEHTDFGKISIEVCEELVFDPLTTPNSFSNRLLHRVDKAIKHGLTFHEYQPIDKKIEKSLLDLGDKWHKSIKGPHLYLGHLNFFESYIGKRWFYVKDGENITSMVMLSKLEAHGGWLLKFLAILPNSFQETSEFLMVSLLKTLQKENCLFLSKGMLPVDQLGEIRGVGPFSTLLFKSTYKVINHFLKFQIHKEYWKRYNPKKSPSYLIFSNSRIGIKEIRAMNKVFKMEN
ncbi:MAG TPA: phosphatidylglycerol lysyltransferase domain-containing protein [Parachlamydiaceae bacterium]|nr:phosphatidylglycerol lysyltransferase domain-containing protein [Parachlamydiaceae bacterium]